MTGPTRPLALLAAAATLVLAAVLAAPRPAGACSSVMLANTSVYDAVVGGRNYDFFAENLLPLDIATVPKGSRIQYTPLLACASPAPLGSAPSKHSFVCAVTARGTLGGKLKKDCPGFAFERYVGTCVEGLNDAGLSVGALTEQSQPLPPNATDAKGQLPGLYFNDAPTLLLSSFGSIAEVRSAFAPSRLRVVQNPTIYEALFKLSPVAATRVNHFVLNDASGACAVVEARLEGSGGGGTGGGRYTWAVLDNPNCIATNAPGLATQVEYAEKFAEGQVAKYGINGRIMYPGFCGVGWDITTWKNNACNSMGRFTTLTMLKAAMYAPFPDPSYPESPAANPGPAHRAMMQALALLDAVKIPGAWPHIGPPGPAPKGDQVIGESEMTVFQVLRDHRQLKWYLRTAASPRWVSVDLRRLFGGAAGGAAAAGGVQGGGPAFRPLAEVAPPGREWAADVTAQLAPGGSGA